MLAVGLDTLQVEVSLPLILVSCMFYHEGILLDAFVCISWGDCVVFVYLFCYAY